MFQKSGGEICVGLRDLKPRPNLSQVQSELYEDRILVFAHKIKNFKNEDRILEFKKSSIFLMTDFKDSLTYNKK